MTRGVRPVSLHLQTRALGIYTNANCPFRSPRSRQALNLG